MRLNLLKFKTQRSLKQRLSSRSSVSYDQATRIGILFSAQDKAKHEEIKEFVKKLEQDGKQVKVLTFLPKDTTNYEFLYDFYNEKDLNFWGSFTSETVNRFTEMPFDFLFYLDLSPNPFTLNVLARSKAKCRVGKYFADGEPYFEFMLEEKDGLKTLIEGIYKYISALR